MRKLRPFIPEDAEVVSQLIIENLRRVLTRDYSIEAVEVLALSYAPTELVQKSKDQYMMVCLEAAGIVGTASLDKDKIRNVFVNVDSHNQGIGTYLMEYLEARAREDRLPQIYLHASPSAQGFYHKLGYVAVGHIEREIDGWALPVIRMEKQLSMTS